jgi:hypothetical protein
VAQGYVSLGPAAGNGCAHAAGTAVHMVVHAWWWCRREGWWECDNEASGRQRLCACSRWGALKWILWWFRAHELCDSNTDGRAGKQPVCASMLSSLVLGGKPCLTVQH